MFTLCLRHNNNITERECRDWLERHQWRCSNRLWWEHSELTWYATWLCSASKSHYLSITWITGLHCVCGLQQAKWSSAPDFIHTHKDQQPWPLQISTTWLGWAVVSKCTSWKVTSLFYWFFSSNNAKLRLLWLAAILLQTFDEFTGFVMRSMKDVYLTVC